MADVDTGDGGQWGGRGYVRFLGVGGLILVGVVLPLAYVALMLTQDDPTIFLRASVTALALVFAASLAGHVGRHRRLRRRVVSGTAAAVLLVALLFLDHSKVGAYTDISLTDPARGFSHPELIAFLRSDPDLFRIDARTDIDDLWQPDTAALYGLDDVWGIANPLLLRQWDRLWEATAAARPRYDMLNVKYVLVRETARRCPRASLRWLSTRRATWPSIATRILPCRGRGWCAM
ncbi:MAG: hypothetical protein R2851_19165 [Caldilineaceae bacterium]